MTSQSGSALQSTVRDLERRREELKLKMHLAKADAKAEWDKAELKWERLKTELARAQQGSGKAMDDVREGVKGLMAEVSDAYKRIRGQLAA